MTGTIEIKSYILSFGPAADVIEPESLGKEVADELQPMLARYTSESPSRINNAASMRK
ncbi:hypothetical protein [Rosistilla carotiformis]